jgi:hypothetical protein
MLIDYFKEVKAEIAERREAEVNNLLNASSTQHDLIKGRVEGIDRVSQILHEVIKRFGDPEDEEHPVVSGSVAVTAGRDYRPIASYKRGRA